MPAQYLAANFGQHRQIYEFPVIHMDAQGQFRDDTSRILIVG